MEKKTILDMNNVYWIDEIRDRIYHSKDKYADAGYELIDTIIEASEQAESEKGLTFKQKHYDKQSFDTIVRKLSTNQFENIVSQLVFNQEIENRPAYIIGCLIENGRSYGNGS